jgi:hypothetical protein
MRQSHGQSSSLPTRFPVGARYVVEGRGGEDGKLRVFSRYIVLPGGRRIKLPADLSRLSGLSEPAPRRAASRSVAGRVRSQSKKNIGRAGTIHQQRH